MLETIQIAYNSGKAALDIAKGIHALGSEVERNQAVIEIQRHVMDSNASLMDAQQAYSASLKRIEELEKQILQFRTWDTECQRYELADTGQGSLAYRVKEGMEQGDPSHWICPNCYQQGKKSILKEESLPIGRSETLVCHPCGFDIVTRGVRLNQTPLSGRTAR